jgi:hypothetical protein
LEARERVWIAQKDVCVTVGIYITRSAHGVAGTLGEGVQRTCHNAEPSRVADCGQIDGACGDQDTAVDSVHGGILRGDLRGAADQDIRFEIAVQIARAADRKPAAGAATADELHSARLREVAEVHRGGQRELRTVHEIRQARAEPLREHLASRKADQ